MHWERGRWEEDRGRGEFMGGEQLVVNQIVACLAAALLAGQPKKAGNEWLDSGKKKLPGKTISTRPSYHKAFPPDRVIDNG